MAKNNTNFGGAGGITITGAPELWIRMNEVGKKVADKISSKALKKALAPVTARAKELAPVGQEVFSGLLKESIGEKFTNKKGTIKGVVGPRRGFKLRIGTRKKGKHKNQAIYKNPTRYAHLVEFGTSHSAAKPFMRPAWNQAGAEQALDTYTKELSKGLDAAVKALRK